MSLKLMSSVEGLAGYSTSDVTSRSAVMPNASKSKNMLTTVDLHSVQASMDKSSSVMAPPPIPSLPPGK